MSRSIKNSILVFAVVSIVIGLVLVIWPMQSKIAICYALGAISLLYGIARIVMYFANKTFAGFERYGIIVGIVAAIFGFVLLFNATAIIAVIGVLIGVAVIIDSIVRLQVALDSRRLGLSWKLPLIFSLVMLVFGIVLLFDPFAGANAATVVAGAALLVDGIMSAWTMIAAGKLFKD